MDNLRESFHPYIRRFERFLDASLYEAVFPLVHWFVGLLVHYFIRRSVGWADRSNSLKFQKLMIWHKNHSGMKPNYFRNSFLYLKSYCRQRGRGGFRGYLRNSFLSGSTELEPITYISKIKTFGQCVWKLEKIFFRKVAGRLEHFNVLNSFFLFFSPLLSTIWHGPSRVSSKSHNFETKAIDKVLEHLDWYARSHRKPTWLWPVKNVLTITNMNSPVSRRASSLSTYCSLPNPMEKPCRRENHAKGKSYA